MQIAYDAYILAHVLSEAPSLLKLKHSRQLTGMIDGSDFSLSLRPKISFKVSYQGIFIFVKYASTLVSMFMSELIAKNTPTQMYPAI
jgi:hypothetical protein